MMIKSRLKEYLSNILISVLLNVAITSAKSIVDFRLSVQKFLTSGSTDVRSAALPLMAFSPVAGNQKKVGYNLVRMAPSQVQTLGGD